MMLLDKPESHPRLQIH